MTPHLERLERRLVPNSTTELISSGTAGQPSESTSGALYDWSSIGFSPGMRQISADGRFVGYGSHAPNVIPNQDNQVVSQVFLYDRMLDQTILVSHAHDAPNKTGNNISGFQSMSADGRFIVYVSLATDLVVGFSNSGVTNGAYYLFDRDLGTTALVSHSFGSATQSSNQTIYESALISADGAFITFVSNSTNLVEDFVPGSLQNQRKNLYLYNRLTGTNTLISHAFNNPNKGGDWNSIVGLMSADARFITFTSGATTLIPGFSGPGGAYLYDRVNGTTELITHPVGGPETTGIDSAPLAISTDGRYITISSSSSLLIAGFVNPVGANNTNTYRYDRITDSMTLATHTPDNPNVGANGSITNTRTSADGSTIVFASTATNLVSGFVDGNGANNYDMFVWSAATGAIALVSHVPGMANQTGSKPSDDVAISGDGSTILFTSFAANLVNGFSSTGFNYNLFAYDRATGVKRLVSHQFGSTIIGGISDSKAPIISQDGVWGGFASDSGNLVPGDLDNLDNVFLWHNPTGNLSIASRRQGTISQSPGGKSDFHQVSSDGRYVVYSSDAPNIVAGQVDFNDAPDVFLYDRQTSTTVLVSRAHDSPTVTGTAGSANPVISGDGRYVAYCSGASNLVAGFTDNNGPMSNYIGADVFLFDRVTGTTTLVSHRFDSMAAGGNRSSGSYYDYQRFGLTISADGRYVGFRSLSDDIVAGFVDANGWDVQGGWLGNDIYIFDRTTGINTLVNRAAGTAVTTGNNLSYNAQLSGDGRFLVYISKATDLVAGYTGPSNYNMYLFDVLNNTNQLVSHGSAGSTISGNGSCFGFVSISADGRFIAYSNTSSDLAAGVIDLNGAYDVYLYDRMADTNTLVSHTANDPLRSSDRISYVLDSSISANGQVVGYMSTSTNLVSGFVDTNGLGMFDIYVFDYATSTNELISHSYLGDNFGSDNDNLSIKLSSDGRFVSWTNQGTNLIEGYIPPYPYPNNVDQIFVHDRLTGFTKLVSHRLNNPLQAAEYGSFNSAINADGSIILFSTLSDLLPGDLNANTDIFAYVTPPPRVTSVQINDGSAQRSVIRSMAITFDDYVFVDSSPLSVVSGQGGAVGGVQLAVNYVNNSTVMSVTFSGANTEFGSLADGKYELRIVSSQVTGVSNLDGNGDGVGGDNYVFTFHRLFGDVNGDGKVSATDFASFIGAYNQPGLAFDFNNDGVVTASDFHAFRLRYGVTLMP